MFNPDPNVKVSLNYIILVGPILILEDVPSDGIFYLCVAYQCSV